MSNLKPPSGAGNNNAVSKQFDKAKEASPLRRLLGELVCVSETAPQAILQR